VFVESLSGAVCADDGEMLLEGRGLVVKVQREFIRVCSCFQFVIRHEALARAMRKLS